MNPTVESACCLSYLMRRRRETLQRTPVTVRMHRAKEVMVMLNTLNSEERPAKKKTQ